MTLAAENAGAEQVNDGEGESRGLNPQGRGDVDAGQAGPLSQHGQRPTAPARGSMCGDARRRSGSDVGRATSFESVGGATRAKVNGR